MRFSSALLADHASVREGLLFVSGGGITQVFAAGFPIPLPAAIALVLEVRPTELGGMGTIDLPLELVVRHRRGGVVGQLRGGLRGEVRDPRHAVRAPLALDLHAVQVPAPGRYVVTARLGTCRASFDFEVIQRDAERLPGPIVGGIGPPASG